MIDMPNTEHGCSCMLLDPLVLSDTRVECSTALPFCYDISHDGSWMFSGTDGITSLDIVSDLASSITIVLQRGLVKLRCDGSGTEFTCVATIGPDTIATLLVEIFNSSVAISGWLNGQVSTLLVGTPGAIPWRIGVTNASLQMVVDSSKNMSMLLQSESAYLATTETVSGNMDFEDIQVGMPLMKLGYPAHISASVVKYTDVLFKDALLIGQASRAALTDQLELELDMTAFTWLFDADRLINVKFTIK
jgi:hypothetical protein